MQEVQIIFVDSLTDLEPSQNFLVRDSNGRVYLGNETGTPDEIPTNSTPVYQNLFMLMGA